MGAGVLDAMIVPCLIARFNFVLSLVLSLSLVSCLFLLSLSVVYVSCLCLCLCLCLWATLCTKARQGNAERPKPAYCNVIRHCLKEMPEKQTPPVRNPVPDPKSLKSKIDSMRPQRNSTEELWVWVWVWVCLWIWRCLCVYIFAKRGQL